MLKHQISRYLYQSFAIPLFFKFDAELIHDQITQFGESLDRFPFLLNTLFAYNNPILKKTVLGVEFPNPIGLSAGFDYDGHLAKAVTAVGFGFATVGTVTAQPYEGNPQPRLKRLPQSQSLLVNKGFKSGGAQAVRDRLDKKGFKSEVIGISVGSSNLSSINSIPKAIDDYLITFNLFNDRSYVKYFELNISCPNTEMTESFTQPKNFSALIKAVVDLKIKQPIFIKMPNEIDPSLSDDLVSLALKNNLRGFIFSNLVKNRSHPDLVPAEVAKVKNFKGNFSGRPTARNAKNLLIHSRKKFGQNIAIVSTGGIFTPEDAWERLSLGADLIQLITGLIYEGPQLPGEINHYLYKNSKL